MADRVHPEPPEPAATEHSPELPDSPRSTDSLTAPTQQLLPKPAPPPGSYVIQVPKDQIYRVPPPENAHRIDIYNRLGKAGRGRRCRCTCSRRLCGAFLGFLLLLAAAAGVLYLVYRPRAPKYSVRSLSVRGLNLSSAAPLSPEIDAVVRADNPNRRIGFYYRRGGDLTVSYDGATLCDGVWPTFFHGRRNVTEFRAALTASGLILSSSTRQALLTAQKQRWVPLSLHVKVPVRVKVGAVTTWTFTVKVRCEITVDKMAADSKILSSSCRERVKL